MATIKELVEASELEELEVDLRRYEYPERKIFATKYAIRKLIEVMSRQGEQLWSAELSLPYQYNSLVHDFIVGGSFDAFDLAHKVSPDDGAIWELKSVDLRLFGWFKEKGIFIVADVDTAFRCKNSGLYPGYRSAVLHTRNRMNLDEPKFHNGDYSDVF